MFHLRALTLAALALASCAVGPQGKADEAKFRADLDVAIADAEALRGAAVAVLQTVPAVETLVADVRAEKFVTAILVDLPAVEALGEAAFAAASPLVKKLLADVKTLDADLKALGRDVRNEKAAPAK